MNRTQIHEKLNKIFAEVFDDDTLVITENTNAMDIDDWDSLAQISLVTTIESEFEIQLKLEEVNAFKNVGEMMDCIEKYINK